MTTDVVALAFCVRMVSLMLTFVSWMSASMTNGSFRFFFLSIFFSLLVSGKWPSFEIVRSKSLFGHNVALFVVSRRIMAWLWPCDDVNLSTCVTEIHDERNQEEKKIEVEKADCRRRENQKRKKKIIATANVVNCFSSLMFVDFFTHFFSSSELADVRLSFIHLSFLVWSVVITFGFGRQTIGWPTTRQRRRIEKRMVKKPFRTMKRTWCDTKQLY